MPKTGEYRQELEPGSQAAAFSRSSVLLDAEGSAEELDQVDPVPWNEGYQKPQCISRVEFLLEVGLDVCVLHEMLLEFLDTETCIPPAAQTPGT